MCGRRGRLFCRRRRAEARFKTSQSVPGYLAGFGRWHAGMPAISAGVSRRCCKIPSGRHRVGHLPRGHADGPGLYDLDVCLATQQHRPNRIIPLSRSGGRDRARLGIAKRSTAMARDSRRHTLLGRCLSGSPAESHNAARTQVAGKPNELCSIWKLTASSPHRLGVAGLMPGDPERTRGRKYHLSSSNRFDTER